MECNREEANRAKVIAEKKMYNKDFAGAQKIALKAQQLFPDLENISQMLTVCNVHCAAQMKVSGSEMDWYGILQIEQMADEASIKKQYRKLALLLHPDKNKFSGAEAAFKLIGEAHGILGDKAKRSLYDIKRRANIRTASTRQPPPHMHKNSYPRRQNVVQNNSNHATSNCPDVKQQRGQTAATFWTLCPFCGIRYQYYRTIVNRALRCQSCQQTFIAYDMNVQGSFSGIDPVYTWSSNQQSNYCHNACMQSTAGNTSGTGFHGRGNTAAEFFSKQGINSEFTGRYQNKDTENGEINKRSQAAKPSANTNRKRGKTVVEESSESCDSGSTTDIEDMEEDRNVEVISNRYPRRSTRQRQNVTYNEDKSDDDDDFKNPPRSKKAKNGRSSVKGNDQNNDAVLKEDPGKTRESSVATTDDDGIETECGESIPSKDSLPNGRDQSGKQKTNGKKQIPADDNQNFKVKDSSESNPAVEARISYPLPVFNDFGKDRTETKFAVDQIWAVYDDVQGMPRFYALIRKIISASFRLRVTWLEAHPHPKSQHEVNWLTAGLPYACGLFKHGRTELVDDHSLFSHLVSWEKGTARATYRIYPKKGEIWAVYKGWNIKWSSNPDEHWKNEFEIVEVLSDFEDGIGVEVSYLVRLENFTSLFQRSMNNGNPFKISAHEMLQFSHMIPHHNMTGNEGEGVPEGAFELDPASLNHGGKESGSSIEEEIPDKHKFPEMRAETDEKDGLKNENLDSTVLSSGSVNGTPYKKDKNANGVKKNCHDDFCNRKHGEAGAPEHEMTGGEDKHPDSADNHSYPSDNEILYPAPEFHEFEKDKTADKFQPGHIWAMYSDVDTLPKYYAQIKNVKTTEFEVHIAWLEECSVLKGEMQWDNNELPLSCGVFKVTDEIQVYSEISVFSHQVKVESAAWKGKFKIYPRKDEIWAIYRDLKSDWTCDDMKNCKYSIAIILDDSDSMFKVSVLKKVRGYNSVFRPCSDTREIRMLEFSHRIPAQHLGKQDGKLKDCYELDPAAVPFSFFCKSSN